MCLKRHLFEPPRVNSIFIDVLVFGTYWAYGPRVVLINTHGGYQKLNDFHIADGSGLDIAASGTGYEACSLQWKNQYYVFGGSGHQVSMLNGDRLEQKAKLKFKGKGESGLLPKSTIRRNINFKCRFVVLGLWCKFYVRRINSY